MPINPPADLFLSPDLYPARIDFDTNLITFIRMSRSTYTHSSFLDQRAWRLSPKEFQIEAGELFRAGTGTGNRICYILHSAYCCSTLLARYMELVPQCFVLREPHLMTQITMQMPNPPGPAEDAGISSAVEPGWMQLFDLCLRLLGRAYRSDETVIIKASDVCNPLAALLLAGDSRSRIVFVSIALKTFLLSVLKAENRRRWLRLRLSFVSRIAALVPELSEIDPLALPDAKGAAYLWLFNEALRRRLVNGRDASRVFSFDGEMIAERPDYVLEMLGSHLELSLDSAHIDQILKHESVHQYSKDRSTPYDKDSRRRALALVEMEFGPEAETGIVWAASAWPDLAGIATPDLPSGPLQC